MVDVLEVSEVVETDVVVVSVVVVAVVVVAVVTVEVVAVVAVVVVVVDVVVVGHPQLMQGQRYTWNWISISMDVLLVDGFWTE